MICSNIVSIIKKHSMCMRNARIKNKNIKIAILQNPLIFPNLQQLYLSDIHVYIHKNSMLIFILYFASIFLHKLKRVLTVVGTF